MPVKNLSSELTLCKVFVHGIGKNRNLSFIGKPATEAALKSFSYIPVVGKLVPDEADENGNVTKYRFVGHSWFKDKDQKMKTDTVPFGVVVADSWAFETLEENGQKVEYVTASVVLFTGRYPELLSAIYDPNGIWFAQSMEVRVQKARIYPQDDKYKEYEKFSYSALCILGKSDDPEKNVEPCFESACFIPANFSLEDEPCFIKDPAEFQAYVDAYFAKQTRKETKMTKEKIAEILATFKVEKVENLDFEISEDMTEEDFTAKVKTFAEKEALKVTFSVTYNTKREALTAALPRVCERNTEGLCVREVWCYVMDMTDTEVIYEQHEQSADNRERNTYRDSYTYDIATNTATLGGSPVAVVPAYLTAEEMAAVDALKKQNKELQDFKDNTLKEKHTAEMQSVFSKFPDLEEIAEFKLLKADYSKYETAEDLSEKCFAIKGRFGIPTAPEKGESKASGVKMPLDQPTGDADESQFGGLFSKYIH